MKNILFIALTILAVSFTSCRDTEKEAETETEELIQEMKDDGAEMKVKEDDGDLKIKMETDEKEVKIKQDDGDTKIKIDNDGQ